jgi:hypothetical protein
MSTCLLAVFSPIDSFRTSVAVVLGCALAVIIVNALVEALVAARKPA